MDKLASQLIKLAKEIQLIDIKDSNDKLDTFETFLNNIKSLTDEEIKEYIDNNEWYFDSQNCAQIIQQLIIDNKDYKNYLDKWLNEKSIAGYMYVDIVWRLINKNQPYEEYLDKMSYQFSKEDWEMIINSLKKHNKPYEEYEKNIIVSEDEFEEDEFEENKWISQVEDFLSEFDYNGINYQAYLDDEYTIENNIVTMNFYIELDEKDLNGSIVFDCSTDSLLIKVNCENRTFERTFVYFNEDKIEDFIADSLENIELAFS